MYSNYKKDNIQGTMETDPKEIPTIFCDETVTPTPRVRKQKGWGHWSAFLKSKEYTDLTPGNKQITDDELAKHNKHGDLWIGLSNEGRVCVYDVTLFAEYHPGGYDILANVAGKDATEEFRVAHAYVSPNMISRFQIGFLVRSRFTSPNSLSPGMSMLAPVRLPPATKKPKWDWTEKDRVVTINITLHKVLIQGLDQVTVQCRDSNVLKMRIFFETEYYYFEIELNAVLTVLLDTINYDEQNNHISLSMTNSSTFQLSHLGGVHEDKMVSLTGSLDKEEFLPCTLLRTRDLNADCREFTIQWPLWARVGVPIGHHVIVKLDIKDDKVQRPYTPVVEITPSDKERRSLNQLTLMIKRYSDGIMSSHMHILDEDSTLFLSLSIGTFKSPIWMNRNPSLTPSSKASSISSVIFIAAGSGITPMIRLMLSCLSSSQLRCHLAFFNRKQCDIIYAEELEALERCYPNRVQTTNVLSQPDHDWSGLTGRISESLCKDLFVSNLDTNLYLICGPTGFNQTATKILSSWKVAESHVWEFKG